MRSKKSRRPQPRQSKQSPPAPSRQQTESPQYFHFSLEDPLSLDPHPSELASDPEPPTPFAVPQDDEEPPHDPSPSPSERVVKSPTSKRSKRKPWSGATHGKKLKNSNEEADLAVNYVDNNVPGKVDVEEKVPDQTEEQMQACANVVESLIAMDESSPFRSPVDPVALNIPDYFNLIATPMDLGTILDGLRGGDRYKNVGEVYSDIQLVWSNCRKYNGKWHPILKPLKALQKAFQKMWSDNSLPTEVPRADTKETVASETEKADELKHNVVVVQELSRGRSWRKSTRPVRAQVDEQEKDHGHKSEKQESNTLQEVEVAFVGEKDLAAMDSFDDTTMSDPGRESEGKLVVKEDEQEEEQEQEQEQEQEEEQEQEQEQEQEEEQRQEEDMGQEQKQDQEQQEEEEEDTQMQSEHNDNEVVVDEMDVSKEVPEPKDMANDGPSHSTHKAAVMPGHKADCKCFVCQSLRRKGRSRVAPTSGGKPQGGQKLSVDVMDADLSAQKPLVSRAVTRELQGLLGNIPSPIPSVEAVAITPAVQQPRTEEVLGIDGGGRDVRQVQPSRRLHHSVMLLGNLLFADSPGAKRWQEASRGQDEKTAACGFVDGSTVEVALMDSCISDIFGVQKT